ncbi:E3 ubiquitin-protein ligase EL5-like [Vicia villosa]|uniref:E3 ubiquitin-protein ligase EL5-like n=1 Tax=Vicia villosa TaxID=3911 RepID=UPI00273B34D2|nr:E3 ubiquitin-protein ligase EL5-like [Vicia villosa]
MENDEGDPTFNHKVIFQIIILVSAAFVVSSVYHLIAICLCHRRRTMTGQNQLQPPNQAAIPSLDVRTSSSVPVVIRIPTHKYHKRDKVDAVSDDEGDTCAVCLGDFEEGEELRTMPECLHSYHVNCIDMWLHSHSSCPICRATADAAPLPAVSANHHSIDMNMAPLGTVMQSGLARLW